MFYSIGLAASSASSAGDLIPILMSLAAVVLAVTIFD